MAYEERDYYREPGVPEYGGGFAYKLLALLNYSFSVGTYAGIRIRIHITFVLLFAFHLLLDGAPWWTLRWTSLLFFSVLLHELGHCFACRSVGGRADDILMWPLGGLAFADPPKRPWPEFVTVIWGPLVNVLICAASYATLVVWVGSENPLSFNPLQIFQGQPHPGIPGFLEDLFYVNYILLLFNLLLVFYPFDGGRLVQIGLWKRVGYQRSMHIATGVGMVGAVGVGLYGIIVQQFLLLLIGVFGLYTCYQQRQQLRHEEAEFGESEWWKQGFDAPDPIVYGEGGGDASGLRQGRLTRWREQRRTRKKLKAVQEAADLEARVDRILEKVSREGMDQLSRKEKRTLREATERRRRV